MEMDNDTVITFLETYVRRIDEHISALRDEIKQLNADMSDIKSKIQVGKGVLVGAVFVLGCAAVGLKAMVFKLMGW
jgi:hypothetical protein